MSYNIHYCIKIDKVLSTNALAKAAIISFEEPVEEGIETAVGGTEVIIRILQHITIIWTPWNYSRFLVRNEDPGPPLKDIEQALRHIFPAQILYRLDELLVEAWEIENNPDWGDSQQKVSDFLRWIRLQNVLYWSVIS